MRLNVDTSGVSLNSSGKEFQRRGASLEGLECEKQDFESLTGSQWRLYNMGVMCSDDFVLVRKRADALCTF